jgi:NAD+ kinase
MAEGGSRSMKRVLLFVNVLKKDAGNLAEEIREKLKSRHIEVESLSAEGAADPDITGTYDAAFTLGGDGTVLYAARAMAIRGVPIIPVNLGTLGFIAAVPPRDWAMVLDKWLAGTADISRRLMLEVRVDRLGKTVKQGACLNDVVISASGISKLIRLQVLSEIPSAAGPARSLVPLGQYRADGLIAATPTGSTAYSMAAGGPILDPEMEALIINPVCPFTLSHRPLVLPARDTVIIEVEQEQRSGVLLTIDGQVTEPLEPGDRILLRQAPYQARLIFADRNAFYKALRTKLNWSGTYSGAAEDSAGGGAGA